MIYFDKQMTNIIKKLLHNNFNNKANHRILNKKILNKKILNKKIIFHC